MVEIKIRLAAFDEPAVQRLVAENMSDLSQRYGGSGDDTPISPRDFSPPNGAFFVAVSCTPAVVGATLTDSPSDAAMRGEELMLGSAGWRRHGEDAELKRMFTTAAARGRGIARRLLATIEESARAAGCKRVILETGDRQPEAIALYTSAGYQRIEDFGYYKGHAGVLSYAKAL